jgi:hypothetical protein
MAYGASSMAASKSIDRKTSDVYSARIIGRPKSPHDFEWPHLYFRCNLFILKVKELKMDASTRQLLGLPKPALAL